MPSIVRDESRHHVVDNRVGHYCCFPDLLRLGDGRLICAYRESDIHIASRRKLLLRESADNGRSWSAPRILLAKGGHCPRLTLLEPDAAPGQIVCLTDDPDTLLWSADSGMTWAAHAVDGMHHGVPDKVLPGRDAAGEAEPNVLLTAAHIQRGTAHAPESGQPRCEQMLYRSKDRGASFTPHSVISSDPCLALCEASLTRLPGGEILALLRENSGVFEPMYACLSTDEGATWSRPRPTPLLGHRPTLGLTRAGKLLVTYRDISPAGGTVAWLGEVEELLTEDAPFAPHGADPERLPEGALTLTPDVLRTLVPVVQTEAERPPAPLFALRPLTDPGTATARLTARVRSLGGERRHCSLRLGLRFDIQPHSIRPDLPGARALKLPENQANDIDIRYEPGNVTLRVNGRIRKRYDVPMDVAARPVCFGAGALRAEAAGEALWSSVALSIQEPIYQRVTDWGWSAADGLPDASARERLLRLAPGGAHPADYGYSGWAETGDGTFCCVYHHAEKDQPDYAAMRKSHIRATLFQLADFTS